MGGISAAISSYQSTGEINGLSVLIGVATGAIGGVVGATGLGWLAQTGISAGLSAVNNVGSSLAQNQDIRCGFFFNI